MDLAPIFARFPWARLESLVWRLGYLLDDPSADLHPEDALFVEELMIKCQLPPTVGPMARQAALNLLEAARLEMERRWGGNSGWGTDGLI